MRRIFTLILLTFIGIQVLSTEMIFKDNDSYPDIEFLYNTGVLDIDLNNLPLTSDALLSAIDNAVLVNQKGKISISTVEETILNKLIRRFNGDNFILREKASIYKNVSVNSEKDTVPFHFLNRVYFSKSVSHGIIAFDIKTIYPYKNTDSTLYRMDEWNSTGSDNNNTFIGYYNRAGFILFGRILPAWGQGIADNIFLSNKILPMDGILADFKSGKFSLSFYLVNKNEYHFSNKNSTGNVYLSAHKISADLPFKTYFALKEMIIYKSNLPQLYYLNPVMTYYIAQYNSHSDDNVFWSLELTNRKIKGLLLSGELFIDDFQYEKEDYYIPNKIGFLTSVAYSPDMIDNIVLYGEYCRMNTYTNTHEYPQLAYMYYKVPMSYMSGTDMDNILFGITYRPLNFLSVRWNVSHLRRGEGVLTNSWETERPEVSPDFPSGNITQTLSTALSLEADPFKWLKINLNAEGRRKRENKELILTGYLTVTL